MDSKDEQALNKAGALLERQTKALESIAHSLELLTQTIAGYGDHKTLEISGVISTRG